MDDGNERGVRQREGRGRVRLTFSGELRAPDMDPLTYEEWSRLVVCPQCGAATGITLEALDAMTVAICPRETCGRSWLGDRIYSAFQLRQMHHFAQHGEEMAVPHPNRVTAMLVPDLEDDDPVLQEDPDPGPSSVNPAAKWAIFSSSIAGQHAPPLVVALGWARGLLSWSLPQDGEIYEHLYPPAGGSALDAHMTQVVLGLALHEAARHHEVHDFAKLEIETAVAQLAGEQAERLRGTRPAGLGDDGGRLRRSDASRLESASAEQWELWCRLAGEVLAGHSGNERLHRIHVERGSTLPLPARIAPRPVVLGHRRAWLPDPNPDLTWYQRHHPAQ